MVPLTITLEASSANREARVSDLSLGGCYVDSIAAVKPDEVILFTLSLPSGRKEPMSGTVVYVHEGIGFGLRFDNLTREQRMMLEQLILVNGGTI